MLKNYKAPGRNMKGAEPTKKGGELIINDMRELE